jgi:HPt (histidine-containing phosphotransfer) domain-containing protein
MDLERLQKHYLERLPARIQLIGELLESGNWIDLKIHCHQIKGSGGSYGFARLSELGKAAEQAIDSERPDRRQRIEELLAEMKSLLSRTPSPSSGEKN